MRRLNILLRRVRKDFPHLDEENIRRAFCFATEHGPKKIRLDGSDGLDHLLSVATILIYNKPDESVILAALLQYAAEKKKNIPEIKTLFGKKVATLATNIADLNAIRMNDDQEQNKKLRTMLLIMARDIRVMVIRLANQLSNMQSLEDLNDDLQKSISRETIEIYAPIANRLGMFHLKNKMENLAFSVLWPQEYKSIFENLQKHFQNKKNILRNSKRCIHRLLMESDISSDIEARTKHLYGIFKKMSQKKVDSVRDVYDIFAIRIIVPSISNCYHALGIVHEHFSPLPDRFKDYIATPKPNGYRGLHTTVLRPLNTRKQHIPIEIQIRTEEMHQEAEFGVAAHWHYKEEKTSQKKAPQNWVQNLIQHNSSENDLLETIFRDSLSDRIFVFTPRGDIKDLPKDATAIDFAFAIHTDVGLHMQMAKIHGIPVSLNYKLKNGDVVEILTDKKSLPRHDWISFCRTHRARDAIRSFLANGDINHFLREGRTTVNRLLLKAGENELDNTLSLLREYNGKPRTLKEREELLVRVGNGSLSAAHVIRGSFHSRTEKKVISSDCVRKDSSAADSQKTVSVGGHTDLPVRYCAYCQPRYGDCLTAFVTRGNHLNIHRKDCALIRAVHEDRFLPAEFQREENI